MSLTFKDLMDAERALRTVQQNINVVNGYKPLDGGTDTLPALYGEKAELLQYARGDIQLSQLSYPARMRMEINPEYGYQGA